MTLESQGIPLSCRVNLVLMAPLPHLFFALSPPLHACLSLSSSSLLQLNLIHSEVSNLAGFDVDGVINPTNTELELKDDLGELQMPHPPTLSGPTELSDLKSLNVQQLNNTYVIGA